MDGNLILQNLGAWMAVVKPRKASWRRGQEKSHRKTEGEDSKESREDGVKLSLHRAPVESQEQVFCPRDLGYSQKQRPKTRGLRMTW